MTSQRANTSHGTNVPWVTASLAATLIALQALAPAVFDHLVFDRSAIMDGQIWRLITGHLVHLDWSHLTLNVTALIGFGYLIETDAGNGRRTLLGVLAAAYVAISAGLLLFNPATAFYAGLSGVLNGLFAYVCLHFFAQNRSWVWAALLVGGGLKIAWEAAFGPAFSAALVWPPEPIAHFAGLIGGMGAAAIQAWRQGRKSWYFPWAFIPA